MTPVKGYLDIEKSISEAKRRFTDAFLGIRNARIKKTQRNDFALRFKYPLLILLCVVCMAAVIVFQVMWQQTDWLYIVCESVIGVGLVAFIVLLSVSWRYTVMNARRAETIEYYNGKIRCVSSVVAGGGRKAEWEEARFFFTPKGEFELFEGGQKTYSPFVFKKFRGHSRNYVLLDAEAIVANFFEGAEVVSDDGRNVALSSGFRFCVEDGVLRYFEIEGMYSECYENNFPIYAPFTVSSSYVFRYEFEQIDRPNFRLILPEITREACKMYFLELPSDKDPDVLIEDLK